MPYPVRARIYPKSGTSGGILGQLKKPLSALNGAIENVPFLNKSSVSRITDSLANSSTLLGNIGDRANQAVTNKVVGAIGDKVGGKLGGSLGGAIGGELGSFVGEKLSSGLNTFFFGEQSGVNYFQGPAEFLRGTGGLTFPNTPMISVSNTVNYEDYDLTHTNYQYLAFKNSRVDQISVAGKFTINTREEADYYLGCLHFLRTVSKMSYGANDPNAGVPPPVMLFDAMGPYAFNAVPVVITRFDQNYEDGYDYVLSSSGTYVPAMTTMTVNMQVYYNPSDLTNKFSTDEFRKGRLLSKGYI